MELVLVLLIYNRVITVINIFFNHISTSFLDILQNCVSLCMLLQHKPSPFNTRFLTCTRKIQQLRKGGRKLKVEAANKM